MPSNKIFNSIISMTNLIELLSSDVGWVRTGDAEMLIQELCRGGRESAGFSVTITMIRVCQR